MSVALSRLHRGLLHAGTVTVCVHVVEKLQDEDLQRRHACQLGVERCEHGPLPWPHVHDSLRWTRKPLECTKHVNNSQRDAVCSSVNVIVIRFFVVVVIIVPEYVTHFTPIRTTDPRLVDSLTHVLEWTHASSLQSSLALSCSNGGVYASSSRTTHSFSHNHSLSVTPTITTPLVCLSPPSVVRAQEWSRSGSFMQKPKQGWLHDDDSLSQGDGVYYPVKVHITCIRVVEML